MSASLESSLRERVDRIESTPAIPAVFLPLLNLLQSQSSASLDEVARLVAYDHAIAAQCLRVASSPLFGLAKAPESIRAAVVMLGLRRVETILLTCCLGNAFSTRDWPIDAKTFWTHSLGCAMASRRFSAKLACCDSDKAYLAGLLHDIGFMVNCIVFPDETSVAVNLAHERQIPLHQAEVATMGFTHSASGKALAEKWHIADDIVQVIACHHLIEDGRSSSPLVALVHLIDLLCRMRNLGYGYYESHGVDLQGDPAWATLVAENKNFDELDIERFTFEMDDSLAEIHQLVNIIFA
ncbi:MAG TPA: HDOD domain-containing protein [Terriglobales bacterium]|jgi:putative nucleotidyltransferase with HDIG domain